MNAEKGLPWQVAAVVAALLFIAVAPLPYGYYTFLRIVVFLAAAFAAYSGFISGKIGQALACATVAILFNPIIQVHFGKDIWVWIDAISGAMFAALAYVHYNRIRIKSHNI
ncbi:MAG: hypothetical protein HC900_00265 [Methylacidiphilales bacterium]|nr:hypothetical protein [Candidatus Methylacidiphilales bacterium]